MQLVDLIQHQNGGFFGPFDQFEHKPVAVPRRNARITHQHDQIDRQYRIVNRRHHPPVEQMPRLMYAGCVDEHDLTIFACNNPFNAVACGLRFVGNGSDLFTDKAI